MDNIIHDVAARLSLNEKGVSAVIKLLDEGATVPFISRYRKEATGALDEVAVRSVETTLKSVRELYTRKEFVADAITAAGAMTACQNHYGRQHAGSSPLGRKIHRKQGHMQCGRCFGWSARHYCRMGFRINPSPQHDPQHIPTARSYSMHCRQGEG